MLTMFVTQKKTEQTLVTVDTLSHCDFVNNFAKETKNEKWNLCQLFLCYNYLLVVLLVMIIIILLLYILGTGETIARQTSWFKGALLGAYPFWKTGSS